MATTPKPLYDGQLPATKTTLYTAAARVRVVMVSLVNTDSVARTVNLYASFGGTSRRLIAKNLSLAAAGAAESHLLYEPAGLYLESGDLLEGDASTAAVIDAVACGVEFT